MIDTVVYRIHGYEKYSHLVKYLEQINTKDYVKKFNHPHLQNINRTSLFYGDTGNILALKHRSSINVPSSHYSISFDLNKERDYIEFNLSIPKYLYSTNVLQFIDPHNIGPRHTFDKFLTFTTRFFADYLPLSPDWEDVEVNRIDLCFNQFFLSKGDALRYLDEQKKLKVEFARSDDNKFDYYGNPNGTSTTIQFVTANYSFKIYHKGTEFRKNDYLKLVKNNPKGYNLSELVDAADKVLRYEMTCRKGLLNYIFKQRMKDDENTMFHHNLSRLRKLRNSLSQILVRAVKAPVILNSKDPVEVFIHKTLPNKSFSFHLSSLWDSPVKKPIDLLTNYCLTFNHELFQHLYDFFWQRVEKYQLGIKMGITDIHKKIKEYQEDRDFKSKLYQKDEFIAHTGNLLLMATLSQYTDISELKNVLPKATYYRYRKRLEELGIPRHSPDIAVKPPALDYVTYFYYFAKNHVVFN